MGALVGACLDVGVIVDFSLKKTFINLSLSLSLALALRSGRETRFSDAMSGE